MLCPVCGADVGTQVQLCESCESAKAAKIASKSSSKQETLAESVLGQVGRNERVERPAPEEPPHKRRAGALIISLVLFLGIVVVKVALRHTVQETTSEDSSEIEIAGENDDSGQAGVASEHSSGSSSSGASSSGSSSVLPSQTKPAATAEVGAIISTTASSLVLGNTEQKFSQAIALYVRAARRLDIAFFKDALPSVDKKALRASGTVDQVSGVRPAAILSLTFRVGSSGCSFEGLEQYRIRLLSGGGWAFAGDSLSLDVLGGTAKGGFIPSPLDVLGCEFREESALALRLRGAKNIFVKDEQVPASWNLGVDSLVVVPTPAVSVSYASASAKSTVGLWDGTKRELNVGFFGSKITRQQRETLRAKRSLQALPGNLPDVVMTFTVGREGKELLQETIKTFGVQIYRARSAQLDFPGSEDSLATFYVGGAQNTGTFGDVRGDLIEGGRVVGAHQNEVKKNVEDTTVDISWQLRWSAVVVDVDAPARLVLPDDDEEELLDDETELPNTDYMSVSADAAQLKGQTSVGLYYPDTGDVAVGIYYEKLNESDIAGIKARGTLSTAVNGKRPMMVIYLDFPVGLSQASFDSLLGYTAYFYRAAGSEFQFGGQQDAVSVKRVKEEVSRVEFRSLKGALGHGGSVHLEMVGAGVAKGNKTRFTWKIVQDIPLLTR